MIADYFAHIVLSSVFARFSLVVPPFTRLGRAMRFFSNFHFYDWSGKLQMDLIGLLPLFSKEPKRGYSFIFE